MSRTQSTQAEKSIIVTAFIEAVRQRITPFFIDTVKRFIDHIPNAIKTYQLSSDAAVNQKIFEIPAVLRNFRPAILREINQIEKAFIAQIQSQAQLASQAKSSATSLEDMQLVDLEEMDAHIIAEISAREVATKIDKTLGEAFKRLKPFLEDTRASGELVFHPLFLIQQMLEVFNICKFNGEQKKALIKLFQTSLDTATLERLILEILQMAKIPEPKLEVVTSGSGGRAPTQGMHAVNGSGGGYGGGYPSGNGFAGNNPMAGRYTGATPPMDGASLYNNYGGGETRPSGPNGPYPTGSMENGGGNTNIYNGNMGTSGSGGASGGNQGFGYNSGNNSVTAPLQGVAPILNYLMAGQGYQTTQPPDMFAGAEGLFGSGGPDLRVPLATMPSIFSGISPSVASNPILPARLNPDAITTVIETSQLISLLSTVQASQLQQIQSYEQDVDTPAKIRQQISKRLKNSSGEYETLLKKDLDIIDLVSTIFDFILDDKNIPVPMKAMLGRLQIPFLKVALTDPELFKQETHPARLLLNLLSSAGMGWQKGEASSNDLFGKIERVVYRLLEEFESNSGVFVELLEEFSEYFTQHQQRQEALAQRTQKNEEQKAQGILVKAEIQKVFHASMTGKELPLPVMRVIHEGLRHVMFLEGVRDGIKSKSWQNNLALLNKLITLSTLSPNRFANHQDYLNSLNKGFATLNEILQQAMNSAHIDPILIKDLLTDLEDMIAQLQQTQSIPTLNVVDQTILDNNKTSEQNVVAINESSGKQVFEAGQTVVVDTPSDPNKGNLPDTDPHMLAVRHIEIGAWLEVIKEDGVRERQKLIARVRTIDRQIFANNRGIKVAEYSTGELANMLKEGQARIIMEQQPLVDRALESLAISLKQNISNAG